MTALWLLHWTVISAGMFLLLYRMHRRHHQDLRKPWVILALALTLSASLLGVAGILDIQEMARRSRIDYAFERRCWGVAVLAVVTSLFWTLISRSRFSFITVAVAVYLAMTWTLVCSTL